MKIITLAEAPELSTALASFESAFSYPLGEGMTFRISHGDDYNLFFQCQGVAKCFIAEDEGRVLGTMSAAVRSLLAPDGTQIRVGYFGDLKIAPQARNGLVLARLAKAAEQWLRPQIKAAFSVAMGGTEQTPDQYTGRAGLPTFARIGSLSVLRIIPKNIGEIAEKVPEFRCSAQAVFPCYARLVRGAYGCPPGYIEMRSVMSPIGLMHRDGTACGILEDTRKAKRLIMSNGAEMQSAHLTCFAFEDVAAAMELLHVALAEATYVGLPAVFISIPTEEVILLELLRSKFCLTVAPAFIYGAGLNSGRWHINTAEI